MVYSFKNQRFTPSGDEDIGIRKFEFVAKIQFLSGEKLKNRQTLFASNKRQNGSMFFSCYLKCRQLNN